MTSEPSPRPGRPSCIENPDVEIVWDDDSDIDPLDTVDIDAQLYKEELAYRRGLDPVGYVKGYTVDGDVYSIRFACGGHTHLVSREDAVRLARSIYDEIEGGEQ